MRALVASVALVALAAPAVQAQAPLPAPPNTAPLPPSAPALPRTHRPRPTTAAITAADLMTRLYIFADDSMQGRETASPGHERGLRYMERELVRLGLVPLGENGSYRQRVPLVRRRWNAFTASVGPRTLRPWRDLVPLPVAGTMRPLDGATVVYGGPWKDAATLPDSLVAGRVVVLGVTGPAMMGTQETVNALLARAAAVVVALPMPVPPLLVDQARQPSFTLVASGPAAPRAAVGVQAFTTLEGAELLLGAPVATLATGTVGGTLRTDARLAEDSVVSYNLLAKLPGRDPALRNEYVAIGAHSDHLGFDGSPVDHDSLMVLNRIAWWEAGATAGRPMLPAPLREAIRVNLDSLRRLRPARPDSIFNGADDDGSGSMAVLEVAENLARAKRKPRRSILFAWHTGEERGLLGSRWLSEHFPVPREAIVAQVNVDMVGRGMAVDVAEQGGPDYVGLVGSKRLSTGFGAMIDSLNAARPTPLTIDYRLDADGHPENVYCRSDHYQYARWGIPVAFFSTGLYGDYHQRTDEPQYIAYGPYAVRTNFIRDVLVATANGARPVVDKPKPDPNAACRQ
jgi:hypothetical protein